MMNTKDDPKKMEKVDQPEEKAAVKRKAPRGVELERTQFRSLLISNPNYFGQFELSPFEPVKVLQGITTYEKLVCLGLNPPYDRLEGVIEINQEFGYGGDICSPGTREFVRFYVDLHDDGVWHDVGVSSVAVHDIPGDKPLCYAVYHDFEPYKKFCLFENIVKVRAILQWNVEPPANTPDYVPVWGNVVTVQVQIHPYHFWPLGDLFKELEAIQVKIPDPIGPVIKEFDPAIKLTLPIAQPLTLLQKKELYAREGVPVHRFAFQEVQSLLKAPDPNFMAPAGQSSLAELGLSLVEIDELISNLVPILDGDTSFEQLRCVGLYPERDMLEAVLTVKKPSGFSGPLCSNGSTEYVAFWMDFADGSGFQYIGTATVNVHDLSTIPDEDVQYAVFLKTDLSKYRLPCEIGPRVARLRAILSWETHPHRPEIPTTFPCGAIGKSARSSCIQECWLGTFR